MRISDWSSDDGSSDLQFYEKKPVPRRVLLSHDREEQTLITGALALRAEYKVELSRPQRGAKRKLIDNALHNAREALARRLAESSSQRKLLEQIAEILGLAGTPERIEVYDNSHTQGSEPYGCMRSEENTYEIKSLMRIWLSASCQK